MADMNLFSDVSACPHYVIEHFLTITGTGSKTVQSDLIILGLNVENLDIDLKESYLKNIQTSNSLSNAFNELNIPEKNIATISYDTTKQYKNVYIPANNTNVQIFEGYLISNKIEVTLSDVDLVSELIERALSIGNILVTNISFDYSRPLQNLLRKSLLTVAAKDAFDRAKLAAGALKVTIDDLSNASVYYSTPFELRSKRDIIERTLSLSSNSGPEIFVGRTKIDVSIFVNFIIRKG